MPDVWKFKFCKLKRKKIDREPLFGIDLLPPGPAPGNKKALEAFAAALEPVVASAGLSSDDKAKVRRFGGRLLPNRIG